MSLINKLCALIRAEYRKGIEKEECSNYIILSSLAKDSLAFILYW